MINSTAKLNKIIQEAAEHVAEAKRFGYSPDPWAEAIVQLSKQRSE